MKLASAGVPTRSGKRIFGLSPWLLVGVSLVLGGAVLVLAIRNSERERGHMVQNYFDRAEALIWALEAGARAEQGFGSQRPLLQALIEETARQPGIVSMSIVTTTGLVLAHSDPMKSGTSVPTESLPAALPEKVTEYKSSGKDASSVYEVFRGFSPVSAAHESRAGHRGDRAQGHTGHPGQHMKSGTGSEADVLEKETATCFIFVGFDKQPFEDALATDYLNNLLTALIVAGMGLAGCISLFWAHGFRDSRRKLKDTRALASEVVTSLPLGLITSDPAGNLGMSNAAALGMFQTTAAAVRGIPVRQIPGLDWDSVTTQLDVNTKVLEREMTLVTQEGRHIPVSVSASEIRGDDGIFLGHLFILRDISELKRLQQEARKNERLNALGNLAAGVAHEIRNPLSSIKGLASYIAQKTSSGAPEGEAAKTIAIEVDRLNRVVSELLEFARPSVVKLSETNVHEVITRALRLSEADLKMGKIRVDYIPNTDIALVPANAERLTQALLNLFLNAAQAMQPDGELRVRVEKASGDEFAIIVSDSGEGILPDAMASLFTPYFTTKPSGTGLGLAIVHQIVEGHGGTISVSSEPGRGATFTLSMPLRQREASCPQEK